MAGKLYTFDKVAPIDTHLLWAIKQRTHLSMKTQKLPNLAQYILRFHYTFADADEMHTFEINSGKFFLSGGKFFDHQDLPFKQKHMIVNAYHDVLDEGQQKKLKTMKEQPVVEKDVVVEISRGIFLGEILESMLRSKVARGA